MAEYSDERPLISDETDESERQHGHPINVEIDVNTGVEKVIEQEILVKPSLERWYILGAFIALSFSQNCIWNTWGPISVSAKFALDWTDFTIALMSNWGPISFIISAVFFSWMLFKSLRWSVVLTALVLVIGSGLRCITSSNPAATWLIHAGQFFNGLGGPVLMGGCPVISALWFPPHQRTTATGLGAGLGILGYATSFLLGPYIVPDVSNDTLHNCANSSALAYKEHNCSEMKHHIKSHIMLYMYGDFALCALLFVMVLIRYPSRPKIPPSLSASIERAPFLPSFMLLFKNWRFWMMALPYGLSTGIMGGWGSVLDINVSPFGVSETAAGWLGFSGTMGGQFAIIMVGIFADVFQRRMKVFLLTLFSLGTVMFTIFALMCSQIVPFNLVILFVVNVLGNIGVWGGVPLFFELACESAYPVAEGITNSLMTFLSNCGSLVFLTILMFPQTGTAWMNWCLAACVACCIPVFAFYKERYTRLDLDTIKHGDTHASQHTQHGGHSNGHAPPTQINHDTHAQRGHANGHAPPMPENSDN